MRKLVTFIIAVLFLSACQGPIADSLASPDDEYGSIKLKNKWRDASKPTGDIIPPTSGGYPSAPPVYYLQPINPYTGQAVVQDNDAATYSYPKYDSSGDNPPLYPPVENTGDNDDDYYYPLYFD